MHRKDSMITTDALSAAQRRGVDELLAAVLAHDGEGPLDEAARLALSGGDAVHLLRLRDDPEGGGSPATAADAGDPTARGSVVGYASILPDGTVQGMVAPERRRRGHGTALLDAALAARPDAGVWAHGALPGSLSFLTSHGLRETRRLLVMRRALRVRSAHAGAPGPADPAALPPVRPADVPGLHLETFDPDRDAEDWIALNAAAFASHPEQGAMTLADFERRRSEPWFDAADLLLARADGELVGFVWTKREQRGAEAETAEIYVVATAPSVQGRGVAGQLLGESLRRLEDDGAAAVELFVEGDNASAIALYERWGFAVADTHVQMRRTSEGRG